MLYNYQYTKGACYSDIPFHTNIIMSCIMGCNSKVKLNKKREKLMSVFFAGEPLAYSMMPDWYSATLMLSGFTSIRYALLIPSLFVTFSLITSFYSLSFLYSKSHFVSSLSLLLLFNLGGLSWTHILEFTYSRFTNRRYSNENIFQFIFSNFDFTIDRHRENDWIHMWGTEKEEYWFHPITHIILPQRGSLWSMPLCYWTIISLVFASKFNDPRFMILAGILTGMTPQVQVHSFVALAQWSIAYCFITFVYEIYQNYQKKLSAFDSTHKSNKIESNTFNLLSKIVLELTLKYVKLWGIYGLISVVVALPQIESFVGRIESSKENFIQFNPIWNTPYQTGKLPRPIRLWWNGLGVFGAISIVFGWVSITKRQLFLYVPSFVVFLIANFIRYQPWELDNTKVFYAGWIPLASPFVATFLSSILSTFSKKKQSFEINKNFENEKESSSDVKTMKSTKINNMNGMNKDGYFERISHNKEAENVEHEENSEKEKEKLKMTKKKNSFKSELKKISLKFYFKAILSSIVFIILLFSTIASSLIHLYQWYFFPCPIYEKEDYLFGLWLAENTPINAIFLSHGYPQDPVGSVAGRQLHLGYPGWVSSHGLDYYQRWDKEHFILQNPEKRFLFEEEKIDYVVHFKYEKKNCQITNIADVWKLVFDTDRYKVWKLIK